MDAHRPVPSYVHGGGEEPLLGVTIDRHFRRVVAEGPNELAIAAPLQGRRLTYGELDGCIEELARGMVALGIEPGHRVAVWSPNNIEWIVVQMAATRVGAELVNLDPAYRSSEFRYAVECAGIETLFLVPSFKGSDYVTMSADVPGLRRRILMHSLDAGETEESSDLLAWSEVLERGRDVDRRTIRGISDSLDFDDPINIQFTSGTTGRPKATVLTHHNLLNNAVEAARVLGFTRADRLCVPVPFFHCFGMVVSTLVCLSSGAAIVLPAPHFDPAATLATIAAERCTAVHGVPAMFLAMLDEPGFGNHDLSSLRTGIMAGAPCPPELIKRVIRDMDCPEILIGYGQTEASPITHLTRPTDSLQRRIHTVGTNLPHQEVKLVDPKTGKSVPTGEPGEVCFRGYHVMRGYLGRTTEGVIDEAGWLHSGDIGVLDDEGYLRIEGRIKEMIIRGGENIFPAEIEAFFHEHEKVADIAVFGVPDERMGEEVAAWIRLHDGVEAAPSEFREFARGKIAHYKIPRYITLVDAFPMTASGKVQKFRIQEAAKKSAAQKAKARSR